jgi:heme a synthase
LSIADCNLEQTQSAIGNWKSKMSKGLNRFAILVASATFFLIIAGALVTSNDAGLATSDWPLSNGQFLPPMVGNMFYEHGHRMIATTVGLLTIGLAIYIRFGDKRFWVWRLGFFALFAVIVQGILGGLTVKMMLPLGVSAAHATLAQLFFCTTVSLAVFTSRSWIEASPLQEVQASTPCLAPHYVTRQSGTSICLSN